MKSSIRIFLFLFLSTLLVRCEKYEAINKPFPSLQTLEVSNISEKGATFNSEITSGSNFTILRYGFVWSEKKDPKIENSDRIVYSKNIHTNKFSAEISTTLKEGSTYHVRSFIETEDYRVYGNDVSFLSLGSSAPQVLSFLPESGTWGDTIKVFGKNFSFIKENNSVKFGEIPSEITTFTDTVLTIVVPAKKNLPTVKINVAVLGNNAPSQEDFHYLIPGIVEIEPVLATFNDTITIKGINFHPKVEYNSILIGNIPADIISVNTTEIKFIIPEELKTKENEIILTSTGFKADKEIRILLKAPVITSFSPDTVRRPKEIVTLRGENFNPLLQSNTVHIGGYEAEIIESSGDSIKVLLPDQIIPENPHNPKFHVSLFTDVSMNVTVAGQSFMSDKNLEIYWLSTYTRKADFPGSARQNAVAFSINGKGYFGTGMAGDDVHAPLLNDFWEYDPVTDNWKQIADFPGKPRAGASAFVIGNEGYVGLGTEDYYWSNPDDNRNHFKDFYKYNPSVGTWIKITDFSGIGRHSAASFSINGEGYIISGYWGSDDPGTGSTLTREVWKYEQLIDRWTQINDFPGGSFKASVAGFNIENDGYVYNYGRLYKFTGDGWIQLPAIDERMWDHLAFSMRGKAYFGLGMGHSYLGNFTIWEYDPLTEISTPKSWDDQYGRGGSSVFVINDKAYIIGGLGSGILKDVWEFDPTKPDLR